MAMTAPSVPALSRERVLATRMALSPTTGVGMSTTSMAPSLKRRATVFMPVHL